MEKFKINSIIDAIGTSGTVLDGCCWGKIEKGDYTGPYAHYQITPNDDVVPGCSVYIYEEAKWTRVINVICESGELTTVYVVPFDQNYCIKITKGAEMLVIPKVS